MTDCKHNNRMENLKLVEELRQKLEQLQKTIDQAQRSMRDASHNFILQHVCLGWQKFHFISTYNGNHPEYCGDEKILYLFRGGISLEAWEKVQFFHYTRSEDQANTRFKEFVGSLVEGCDYLIVP